MLLGREEEVDVEEGFPLLLDDETTPEDDIGSPEPEDLGSTRATHAAKRGFQSRRWQVTSPKAIVRLIVLFKFSIVLSGTLIMLPFFRILEDLFCHQYFNDTTPGFLDEKKCKEDGVQQSLAYFFGWLTVVNSVVGVAIALPYGSLADRLGRKPVLIFSYGGVCFSFATTPLYFHYFRNINPYFILLGSVGQAFGGGIPVALSTLYAIATDVTSEEERGSSFLLLTLGATIAGLIGPLISGLLMERFSPWVPIYIISALSPFFIAAMFLLPETLQRKPQAEDDDQNQTLVEWLKCQVTDSITQVREAFPLLRSRDIKFILAIFFINTPIGAALSLTLIQYVSKTFGWDVAETSYLLSPLGLLTIVVLAGLPKLGEVLISPDHRFKMTVWQKDYLLTGLSLVFLALGGVIEGLAPTAGLFIFGLFIGNFGSGHTPLARALLTHYADSQLTSRLMALISIVEAAGAFIGGPILAVFFQIGQSKGGYWTGLPYLYIAFLCLCARACLIFVRAPEKPEEVALDSTERDTDSLENDEPDAPLISL